MHAVKIELASKRRNEQNSDPVNLKLFPRNNIGLHFALIYTHLSMNPPYPMKRRALMDSELEPV